MRSTAASQQAKSSLNDLACAAKLDRNRAIDLYRVLAMFAVTIGHWLAIVVGIDAEGDLVTGNALEFIPSLAWLSWVFQVMPLFFVVGGFSSAMSLDSHMAKDGRPQDWVIARLRRMLSPTLFLAGFWLLAILLGAGFGVGELAFAGAVAAAIPLWFLANYTIDTAIAPYVLPLFRRNPRLLATFAAALFLVVEAIRLAGVPYLPQINWVLGWLMFQVAGFAWRDGLLPVGKNIFGLAVLFWIAAFGLVGFGAWPTAMVHFPGLENSPTHPPSLALMLFGAAYSATAVGLAPTVNSWLSRRRLAWKTVVAANSVGLSVYLWHFTSAVIASAVLYSFGWLTTATVGTLSWWLDKMLYVVCSLLILTALVAVVSRFERRALLAKRTAWPSGQISMLLAALAVSASVKLWVSGNPTGLTAGILALLVMGFGAKMWTREARSIKLLGQDSFRSSGPSSSVESLNRHVG